MFHCLALVTVVNLSTNPDGTTRKRGLRAIELRVESTSQTIRLRSLRRLVESAIRQAGIVPQAIRQVDVYAGGMLVDQLAPTWDRRCPTCRETINSGCCCDLLREAAAILGHNASQAIESLGKGVGQ